jgi:cell wall-associated NlpC family hydrolase
VQRYRSGVTATSRACGARRRFRLLAASGAAAALCLSTVPSAVADKGDRAFPTEGQVAAAERRAEATARDVGAIKASLLLANQRLEAAAVRAAQASEAYNGAKWRLQVAKEEVRKAQAEAGEARRTVEEQRGRIGALVAASYQQGAELTSLGAMMGADGPEGVLDQYAGFQGASSSLQADYDRFAAADALAQVFERKAEEVRSEQRRLAERARVAKDEATAAAGQAQAAAEQIAAEKDRLIRELATAQNISVRLARQRQAALEEIAQRRAEERARAEAEAAARKQARQEAAAAAKAAAAARARAEAKARADRKSRNDKQDHRQAGGDKQGTERNREPKRSSPPPEPAPAAPRPAPSTRSGADQAIAFAKAQVGEPYQWGAAGPDSWDCSGLTMRAWEQAGVSLPHYSVAQYHAGTPISVNELRRGDLVFWGSSSSPESIYHLGMYIGDGMMVHAPRTGRDVEIVSIYYWIPPNFFARV